MSYRQIRYGSENFNDIDHADNNLVNGFLGFVVLAVIYSINRQINLDKLTDKRVWIWVSYAVSCNASVRLKVLPTPPECDDYKKKHRSALIFMP